MAPVQLRVPTVVIDRLAAEAAGVLKAVSVMQGLVPQLLVAQAVQLSQAQHAQSTEQLRTSMVHDKLTGSLLALLQIEIGGRQWPP